MSNAIGTERKKGKREILLPSTTTLREMS